MKKIILFHLIILAASSLCAQSKFGFEISGGVVAPVKGPGGYGHTGTLFYNLDDNFSLMVTTGLLKMENQKVYLRDNDNTDFNIKNGGEFKIVPFIVGGRYNLDYENNIKPFIELDAGINYLSFVHKANSINNLFVVEGFQTKEDSPRLNSRNEMHIGFGFGGGFNYIISDYIELVIKAKVHIAGNAQHKPIFSSASKYFSFMVGLNISI